MTAATVGLRQLVKPRPGRGGTLAVLDVGTSKICCYIGRPAGQGGFRLIGRGYQLADGLKAGEIVDVEAAEASIQAVLHEAEQQAGETIREVVATVGAGRPRSQLLRVERPLNGRSVAEEDIQRSLERARLEMVAPGVTVLHTLPVEAVVDDGRPLEDPRGVTGERLDLLVHLVVADSQPVRNLMACLERCHLEVRSLVAAPFAAGMGCLAEDEMRRGVLLVDIGAGATQAAHFSGGRLLHVDQILKGGDKITGDLAFGLSTSQREAERIKNLYGGVLWRSCDDNVRVAVPLIGDHADLPTGEVPRTRLTYIIRARVEEIFQELMGRLQRAADVLQAKPPRSIVLTGGAAQIEGMDELAEELFRLPARIGRPRAVEGRHGSEDDPCCSAAAGALLLAARGDGGLGWSDTSERPKLAESITRFREWLRQNF